MGRQERQVNRQADRVAREVTRQQQEDEVRQNREAARTARIDAFLDKSSDQLARMAAEAFLDGERGGIDWQATQYSRATALAGFATLAHLRETGEVKPAAEVEN